MSNSSEPKWIKVGDLPDALFVCSQVIKLNEHEFISVPVAQHGKANAISKYNIHTNEWRELMKYPKDINIKGCSLAINPERNRLYLTARNIPMIICDIKTAQFNIKECDLTEFNRKFLPLRNRLRAHY